MASNESLVPWFMNPNKHRDLYNLRVPALANDDTVACLGIIMKGSYSSSHGACFNNNSAPDINNFSE